MHLGTRSLTLTVNGVSRTGDVSDCRIVSGPRGAGSPPRAIGEPDREYRLQGTAAQDPATGSLWDLVWSSVGQEAEIDLRPAGGTAPTEGQPSFVGTAVITEPDGDLLGGQADSSTANRFTFAIDWRYTAKPTRLVA